MVAILRSPIASSALANVDHLGDPFSFTLSSCLSQADKHSRRHVCVSPPFDMTSFSILLSVGSWIPNCNPKLYQVVSYSAHQIEIEEL